MVNGHEGAPPRAAAHQRGIGKGKAEKSASRPESVDGGVVLIPSVSRAKTYPPITLLNRAFLPPMLPDNAA